MIWFHFEKVLAFKTSSSLHSDADKISSRAAGKANRCHLDDNDSAFISELLGRYSLQTIFLRAFIVITLMG